MRGPRRPTSGEVIAEIWWDGAGEIEGMWNVLDRWSHPTSEMPT
jgi:hypothetical protein